MAAKSEDGMLKRAGRLGTAHELATLEKLKKTREVIKFARGDFSDFERGAADTHEALKRDANVVNQATLFDGHLLGYADVIMKNDAYP